LSDAELYLFDRVIVMSRGELVWSGPPYEAVGWFERVTSTPSPTTRTALDFLHEASGVEPRTGVAYTESPEYEQHVGEALCRDVDIPAAPTLTPHRTRGLRRLYAQQVRRRSTYLMIRLAQPPLFAVLFLLLAQRLLDNFDFVFFSALAAVMWLGASGAGTEILRERTFFLHQRAGGTSPRDYMLAKLPIQILLISVQVALLLLTPVPIHSWSDRHWFDPFLLSFYGMVWAVGIVATLAGLAGSAVVAVSVGNGQRAPASWLVSIALVTGAFVVLASRVHQSLIADETARMMANAGAAGVAIVLAYSLAVRAAAWGRS
jgi:hypothetical protein